MDPRGSGLSGLEVGDAALRYGQVALEPGEKFGAGGAGHVPLDFATSTELPDMAVAGLKPGIDALTRA